jgi:hypothetical protein
MRIWIVFLLLGTHSAAYALSTVLSNFSPRAHRPLGFRLALALLTSVFCAHAGMAASLFSASDTPFLITANDPNAMELGVKFRASVNGTVTAIRFYKGPMNTGTHTGHLWSASGSLLASTTFTNETSSGWQQTNFSNPVTITAGTTYIISYHTAVGYYSGTWNYFTSPYTNGQLSCPASTAANPNGVFAYGTSAFPTSTSSAANYWVDIVFNPTTVLNGTQFYVSPSGNDSNPGTLALPWRTIQKSMNSATAGSTVNIAAGTYTERLSVNVSGTPGNYITFQPLGYTGLSSEGTPGGASIAYNGYQTCVGAQVILDYTSLGTITDRTPFLAISDQSYVTIQGITFQNLTYDGQCQGIWIENGSSNIIFQNNRVINVSSPYTAKDGTHWMALIRLLVCNNVTIEGNEIGNVVTLSGEPCTMDGSLGACTNAVISSNYIHDTDGSGIDLYYGATGATITGNLLEYVSLQRDGTVWYDLPGTAIYVDGGNTSVIERNSVRNSEWAIEALAEPGNPYAYGLIIRDNIAYSNQQAGIMLGNWYSSTNGSVLYDVTVSNNTLYHNAYGFVIKPYTSASIVWENNLLMNNTTSISNGDNWPVGTMNYNLYYGEAAGPDINQVDANPLFVNATASPPNFALTSGSPAINAGNPAFVAGSGEADFISNPRVVGGRVDIGAYEFQ